MITYILRRMVILVPVLLAISFVSFAIIDLPPGDYLTSYVSKLTQGGQTVSQAEVAALKVRYGLDQPFMVRYYRWISGIVTRGDFGQSFEWNRPVRALLWDKVGLTFVVALSSLLLTWTIALVIGILSAVYRYSIGDYVATLLAFTGVAIPDFLLALVVLWIAFARFGVSAGGLFSPEFADARWSLAKIVDLLKHLWVPMLILGIGGTGSLIRILRANLLDELHRPYVVAARARGLPEWKLLLRYPVRVALNPFVSTVGWSLPHLVSGAVIVSVVLNLPTTGPVLLGALQSQDMYLAGSFILVLSTLTVIGTLISDVLLAWLDPRIRLG